MTSCKKPGVAFWATVLAVVMLVYVASVGPAALLYHKLGRPFWLNTMELRIYWPLLWGVDSSPDWVRSAYIAYVDWWSPP